MKKNSNRIIRINEEIKHELSAIIREGLKDPRVDTLTSIIEVDTTADLKQCKIFFSTLGDQAKHQETLEGFKNSAGFIRRELAHRVNLRNTPELKFIVDHSIEYGVKMGKLISDVAEHDHLNELRSDANGNEANSNEANSNEANSNDAIEEIELTENTQQKVDENED